MSRTDAAGKILSINTVLEKHWKCNLHCNDKGPSCCCGKDETARGVTAKAQADLQPYYHLHGSTNHKITRSEQFSHEQTGHEGHQHQKAKGLSKLGSQPPPQVI